MNSSAKIFDINKNFETDYWGISNKNLSKKIEQDYVNKNSLNKTVFMEVNMQRFF